MLNSLGNLSKTFKDFMGSSQFTSHGLKNKEPKQHVLRNINKFMLSRIHLFSCMATLLSQKIYSAICNGCPFLG